MQRRATSYAAPGRNSYPAAAVQSRQPAAASSHEQILDQKIGDVTGDGVPDLVYLTGKKQADSPYIQQITLHVTDGQTRQTTAVALPQNSGYHPTLQLTDVTGNRIQDILIVIDSGGSGAFIFSYVYSYLNNRPQALFDSDAYNQHHKYNVTYLDGFRVRAVSHQPQASYIIDLTYKGRDYLSEIYTSSGKLKQPIQGDVNALSGLYPIDFDRDGQSELMALQRITGRYNADGLGYFMNVLKWNRDRFDVSQQWVWISGANG
ncbi:hypothetical protein [Paenibacillus senegalensis]|uniref:hypothetical protein n=1 Tax=Paenibacillus senegalensis TaxID=1465766 RepID=UPI000287C397|nr:hypothetical protein [Paenibacillus senegalensis]